MSENIHVVTDLPDNAPRFTTSTKKKIAAGFGVALLAAGVILTINDKVGGKTKGDVAKEKAAAENLDTDTNI